MYAKRNFSSIIILLKWLIMRIINYFCKNNPILRSRKKDLSVFEARAGKQTGISRCYDNLKRLKISI